jgi:NADH-quinone oxidoreductase subunit A
MTLLPTLAQAVTETTSAGAPSSWLPVVILLIIGIGFAVGNIAISLLVGPSRTGPGKETTYESGMMPIGDTRKRFNVRFYIVAMIFLVIDVEIVFFYPWATIFAPVIQTGSRTQSNLMLLEIVVFVVILLVAYLYAWGKGVFRWD